MPLNRTAPASGADPMSTPATVTPNVLHHHTVDTNMTDARCDSCGFTAPDGSDEWDRVDYAPMGALTQCPECGSTEVYSRG